MTVYTLRMAKKRASPWPARLKKLQDRLGYTNAQMADLIGVNLRSWVAWKYGERNPSKSAARLIGMAEQGKL